MAKVSGPLFSMEASGAYAGAVVFAKWKGRAYARQLVTPANPKSANQETARNRMRVAGAIQRQVNLSTQKHPSNTLRDKLEIAAVTPAGQAWNGYLVDTMIGTGGVAYDAAQAAWTALSSQNKTDWNGAAAALATPFLAVAQTNAGGTAATPLTAGNVFFIHCYAMSLMGLVPTPTGTPPTYVN